MKEFFQTDLPCFQKQDGERLFDPLDAMRRDAHREVVLWLEMLPKDKGREEGAPRRAGPGEGLARGRGRGRNGLPWRRWQKAELNRLKIEEVI